MTQSRDEIIKAAKELAEWFDSAIYLVGNKEKAESIRKIIALVPGEGEVSNKDFTSCRCGEAKHIYSKLIYRGHRGEDAWIIECHHCGRIISTVPCHI